MPDQNPLELANEAETGFYTLPYCIVRWRAEFIAGFKLKGILNLFLRISFSPCSNNASIGLAYICRLVFLVDGIPRRVKPKTSKLSAMFDLIQITLVSRLERLIY